MVHIKILGAYIFNFMNNDIHLIIIILTLNKCYHILKNNYKQCSLLLYCVRKYHKSFNLNSGIK